MSNGQFPDHLELRLLRRYHRRRHWWQLLRKRRRRFQLRAPFRYVRTDRRSTITVPIGFTVDGASIPCCFWRVIGNPWGDYAEASVVHDWLWVEALSGRCSFRQANAVFLEAMESLDVAPWRRRLMWLGVTLAGWWVRLRSDH